MIFKKYSWTHDMCIGCGDSIHYEEEVGFFAIKEQMSIHDVEQYQDTIEKFLFCSECGTDIDLLQSLGMKRIVATVTQESDTGNMGNDSGIKN